MGTTPSLLPLPSSLLSAGFSGVNFKGERSQDQRVHNATDCWLLMLRLVLRGGTGLCLSVCVCVCICLITLVFFVCWSSCERLSVTISFSDMFAKERHARGRNLIGWTTLTDETWWTPGFLSSHWWGFRGLSLRGEIQFPPPARLLCLDRSGWDRRGCVTLQIIHIWWKVVWEGAVWSAVWCGSPEMQIDKYLRVCHFLKFVLKI